MSIPKTIHYCWFGKNIMPKLAKKCIKSWKRKLKGYEIIEWNEDNFDIDSAPLYVKQAYEAKKWAFVSDYVRLYALVNYGGIYMDTDVEVLKKLDSFLSHHAFSGFEDEYHIPTGIMACEKGYKLFEEFLHFYDEVKFINDDGSYNLTTNVTIITDICKKKGLIPNNTYQEIDGFALYPKDYFCPINYQDFSLVSTKNTVTIHWFSGSWVSKKQQEKRNKQYEALKKRAPLRFARKLLGTNVYEIIRARIMRLK